jgi:hypothetical protein
MTWDMILYFQCEMKGVQHLFKKQQKGNPPSFHIAQKENKRWQAGTRNTEKGTPPSSNFNVIMPRIVSTLSGNIDVLSHRIQDSLVPPWVTAEESNMF